MRVFWNDQLRFQSMEIQTEWFHLLSDDSLDEVLEPWGLKIFFSGPNEKDMLEVNHIL